MELKKLSTMTKFSKTIEYWLSEKGTPKFIINTILFLIFFAMSTLIHELGHTVVANLLGCPAAIYELHLLTGATGVAECSATSLQYIALAGPLVSFLAGLYLWFTEEDGKIRMLSIILFFLSSIFQLYPSGTLDGGMAIKYGMNPLTVWALWLLIVGVTANLFALEITEQESKIYQSP